MTIPSLNYPIRELRIALTTSDYEQLVKFYCDGLGIEPAAIWNNGQGQALVLNMGNATLEIFDEVQAETIDQLGGWRSLQAAGGRASALGAIHNMERFGERIATARKYLPDFGLGAYCGFGRLPPSELANIRADHLNAVEIAARH